MKTERCLDKPAIIVAVIVLFIFAGLIAYGRYISAIELDMHVLKNKTAWLMPIAVLGFGLATFGSVTVSTSILLRKLKASRKKT